MNIKTNNTPKVDSLFSEQKKDSVNDIDPSVGNDIDKRLIEQVQARNALDVKAVSQEEADPFEALMQKSTNAKKIQKKAKELVSEGVSPDVALKQATYEERKEFPSKPQIINWDSEDGNRSTQNAFFGYELLVHSPKAYGALNGRKSSVSDKTKKRLRPIPNIFRFAAKTSVIVDYALKTPNHIMAYQFLLKIEELIAELEQEIKVLDSVAKKKVNELTQFGTRTKKLESDRPSVFTIAFKNPYAQNLTMLIAMYDHVERTLLPMRASGMITSREYVQLHLPIQKLVNRIKSLPEMFTNKHKFAGGRVSDLDDKGSLLAEKLDLLGFVKASKKSEEDADLGKKLESLFNIVGQPTTALLEGKIKPEMVQQLPFIKYE